jgi:uncharacterized membrane protein
MKSVARHRIERLSHAVVSRIPIVKGVYSTVSQLMGMLKQDSQGQLGSMSVVFCSFGQQQGAGCLCLLASPEVYRMAERDYHLLFVPTAPIPMSGAMLFVPVESVKPVSMTVEQLMRLYLSMGLLSQQVMPGACRQPQDEVSTVCKS